MTSALHKLIVRTWNLGTWIVWRSKYPEPRTQGWGVQNDKAISPLESGWCNNCLWDDTLLFIATKMLMYNYILFSGSYVHCFFKRGSWIDSLQIEMFWAVSIRRKKENRRKSHGLHHLGGTHGRGLGPDLSDRSCE